MRAGPILVISVALASPGLARAQGGDSVTVRAVPGQVYEGFLLAPGETHAYEIESLPFEPITVSLKVLKGSALQPDIMLEDPDSTDITSELEPYRKDSARGVSLKAAPLPGVLGRYVLRVLGKNESTGSYSLKVSMKLPLFGGEGFVPGTDGSDEVGFYPPAESLVTLTIKPTSPGSLVPTFLEVTAPECLTARIVPSEKKTGVATLKAPATGAYSVRVGGAGGTAGAFQWTAKLKAAKPSRAVVRVNAGAASFPDPGPSPAKLFLTVGQAVAGFQADGTDLAWREYRTQANPQQAGKNSIAIAALKGARETKLANNFETDGSPKPDAFALGPTHVAAVAANFVYAVPRAGGPIEALDDVAGSVLRLLCDESSAFFLRADGLFVVPLEGGSASALPTAAGTLADAVLGGPGIVYAVVTQDGELEIRSMTVEGESDSLVTSLGQDPGLLAMAARGADVFVAVDDGAGGSRLLRAPVCGGFARELLSAGPIFALAVDDLFVYALEEDPVDGRWVLQVPRGGGVGTVIVRENPDGSFAIETSGLAAADGSAYFLATEEGSLGFWSVKRR